MSNTRAWVLGVITAMLAVIVVGYTLGISPVFTSIAEANGQLTSTQASNQSSHAQLAALKVQFDNIQKLKTKLKTLQLSIPEAQAAAAIIDELTTLSAQSGVVLQSVSIASATLYVAPAAPAPTGGAAAAAPSPSPTPTAAITSAVTAPTVTASGLVLIPVIVSVKGSFEATRLFVGALQVGQRLLAMSSVNMTTNSSDKSVTATVTGFIFSLQGASDLVPKANGKPTPTPTATPTPTPTATPTATASGKKSGATGATPTATPTP